VTVVIVRGLGDIGSAVAHLLFREGYGVALHDEPRPATTRRGMAFADAAFDGEAELDGVRAVRADTAEEVALALAGRTAMLIGNRNPAWFWNDLHASCRRSAAAIAASGAEKVRQCESRAAPRSTTWRVSQAWRRAAATMMSAASSAVNASVLMTRS
jgi:hypothetical protein